MKFVVGADGRCVDFTPEDRWRAVQQFVRPDQAVAVLPAAPRLAIFRAEQVGAIIRALKAHRVIQFCDDPEHCDLWRDPEQFLADGCGDCDDHALFGCSLALVDGRIDAGVVIGELWLEEEQRWGGHAWVEGRDSAGWFLLEATSGNVFRQARPDNYLAHYLLRPTWAAAS